MKPKLTTRILKYLLITSVAIAVATALIWIILQGYSAPWTGFADFTKPNSDFTRGKTLWDWMQLFIIPIFLSVGVFFLNRSERESERQRAEERTNLEREIAADRQQEAAFQAYLDRMADLLLKGELRTTENEEMHNVARTRTLTVLRGLDKTRKGLVLRFLQESNLLTKEKAVLDLNSADLSGAILSNAILSNVDLRGVNLSNAELRGTNLRGANLSGTNLRRANLSGADLRDVNLSSVDLSDAILYHSFLSNADLTIANMQRANLSSAVLNDAILIDAILVDAILNASDLSGANLSGADLSGTDFSSVNLSHAFMRGANLKGANLNDANLSGASVTNEHLATTKSMNGTILPDGTKHD